VFRRTAHTPDYVTGEAIRLDLSKRIEDDFGYDIDWEQLGEGGSQDALAGEHAGIWRTHVPVMCSIGDHELRLEIEFRPEVNEYKIQLVWLWEGMSQPVVRYENSGRHGEIRGPHLNWGRKQGRQVDPSEVPDDNLPEAVRRFCQLPAVGIILTGDLMSCPPRNHGKG
jgi:hypothetical protein